MRNAQVQVIRALVAPYQHMMDKLTIDVLTIDAVQGQERDVIVLSLVRSKPAGAQKNLEFVMNDKRANVALTRARHALWVVGNEETLGGVADGQCSLCTAVLTHVPRAVCVH